MNHHCMSRLRDARKRAGLTQEELASRSSRTKRSRPTLSGSGHRSQRWATLKTSRAHGVIVCPDRDLPRGVDGLALPHALIVRPSRQRALYVLRLLHELAHHLLGQSRAHTHADVWRLTLALAWPVLRFRRGLPSLEVPLWASELRALIVAESRLIPAA